MVQYGSRRAIMRPPGPIIYEKDNVKIIRHPGIEWVLYVDGEFLLQVNAKANTNDIRFPECEQRHIAALLKAYNKLQDDGHNSL